jgi:uncharacterized SAM-binding protein YcdF (DUF218 family)
MGAPLRFLFSASGPILALCILAVWLSRRPSPGAAMRRFAIAAAVCYLLAGLAIVPYGMSRLLAAGYHQLRAQDVPAGATAIVLLGGGDRFVAGWTDTITVTTPIEAERVLEAARVFRLVSPSWIISSGGRPEVQDRGEPSAVTMRDELVRLGVPAARVLLEAASRDTHENALFVAPLLKSLAIDHVVLVTSATHMRRSIGAFRAVGVEAIPAVARGGDPPSRWAEWLPTTDALEWSGEVARELGGVPYYWLRGWWRR